MLGFDEIGTPYILEFMLVFAWHDVALNPNWERDKFRGQKLMCRVVYFLNTVSCFRKLALFGRLKKLVADCVRK